MDYLYIGSNGFAQLGDCDYYEKNRVEMKVLLNFLKNNHPIPEEFTHMCNYKIKWFNHDFGMYSEIVLIYNDSLLCLCEESDSEKFNRFWNWFNKIEQVDLESESLTAVMQDEYKFIAQNENVAKSIFS